MDICLQKLVSVSSGALCKNRPALARDILTTFGAQGSDLERLLRLKNGFYAFESALHVLPSKCMNAAMDLERWNHGELWKQDYLGLTNGYLFFAEDIFGDQFALSAQGVFRFDPENGEFEAFAASLEEWAEILLVNYEVATGYPLASAWQLQNRMLALGERLIPTYPFILGGEYSVDNLFALNAVKGMKFRAEIWRQIKDLPVGTRLEYKVVKLPA